jgi:hypothetical protein
MKRVSLVRCESVNEQPRLSMGRRVWRPANPTPQTRLPARIHQGAARTTHFSAVLNITRDSRLIDLRDEGQRSHATWGRIASRYNLPTQRNTLRCGGRQIPQASSSQIFSPLRKGLEPSY